MSFKRVETSFILLLFIVASVAAKFGQAPAGWDDIKFGLVSNGSPYTEENKLSYDTRRLKVATDSLEIKIDYRYRYVNEGVDFRKNACVNLFPKPYEGTDYAKTADSLTGTVSSYVIYVLQEENYRKGLIDNISTVEKVQDFFETLRIVAQNANGYGATIVVEPDTWGYFLQDAIVNDVIVKELDPRKVPAIVNNIPTLKYMDTTINPDWAANTYDTVIQEIVHDFSYLSDLPNNLSGFARAMTRILHKHAPDAYVGFLASHWSIQLNMANEGWNTGGLVWSSDALRDTSAKMNIEFFQQLHWGSVSEESPLLPGDSPDFIGMEKNGWDAGLYETEKVDGNGNPVMYWYWGEEQMRNYLSWSKQIAQGLDLPIVGWQISIGNMDNPNIQDYNNMANAHKDTFFPYFFEHVDEFVDAGYIGFLVGKGLQQGTDYTLPGEGVGENGWFFNQLIEFDKKRPYLDTTNQTPIADKQFKGDSKAGKMFMSGRTNGLSLSFSNLYSNNKTVKVGVYNLRGQMVSRLEATTGSDIFVPTSLLAPSSYVLKVDVDGHNYVRKISTVN